MIVLVLMEQYSMTYPEYLETPIHIVRLMRERMVRDNKEKEQQLRKMKHGHSRY